MTNVHRLHLLLLTCVYGTSKGAGDESLEIDIHVNFLNTSFVQLVCSSERSTSLCGSEFLFNNKTIEELKWVNHTCYHIKGECIPNKCACDQSCKTYVLNLTIPENKHKHLFGCSARYHDIDNFYKSNISKEYNSTGHPLDKENHQIDITTKSNIVEDSETCDSTTSGISVGILSGVEGVVIIALIGFIVYREKRKKEITKAGYEMANTEPDNKGCEPNEMDTYVTSTLNQSSQEYKDPQEPDNVTRDLDQQRSLESTGGSAYDTPKSSPKNVRETMTVKNNL